MLVETAVCPKTIILIIESQTVTLRRSMAHQIQRGSHFALIIFISHTGIIMFMSLKHQIDPIFAEQPVEHPTHRKVVHFTFNGVYRMMEHDYFPFLFRSFQRFLQPFALREKEPRVTVTIQCNNGGIIVIDRIHIIILVS